MIFFHIRVEVVVAVVVVVVVDMTDDLNIFSPI
jgi:hypothetical protein